MNTHPAPRSLDWRPLHALVLVAFIMAAASVPALRLWPWCWLAPLSAYAAIVASVPPLRATFQRWELGTMTRRTGLAALALAAAACATLIIFQIFAHPDVHGYARLLPVTAFGGIAIFAPLFSVLNALCEEVIFRGVLFDAIASQWNTRTAALATAFLFGYGHLQGYPSGIFGAVLAGIIGLGLGWLRVATGGLGLAVLAHIVADATIITIFAKAGVQ